MILSLKNNFNNFFFLSSKKSSYLGQISFSSPIKLFDVDFRSLASHWMDLGTSYALARSLARALTIALRTSRF